MLSNLWATDAPSLDELLVGVVDLKGAMDEKCFDCSSLVSTTSTTLWLLKCCKTSSILPMASHALAKPSFHEQVVLEAIDSNVVALEAAVAGST